MNTPQKKFYFKRDHQEVFVKGLKRFSEPINEIHKKYFGTKARNFDETRAFQYIILTIFQIFFGLVRNSAYTVLSSDAAELIKKYMLKEANTFPGNSTCSVRMKEVRSLYANEINDIVSKFQDFFYVSVGNTARNQYKKLIKNTRIKVTPFPEMFIGIVPPSEIFPDLKAHERGKLIPFLNARLYMKAKEYTSNEEFIGDIKQGELDGGFLRFKLAGRLGFVKGAPGRKKFVYNFQIVDYYLERFETKINEMLAKQGIINLTVVSVDSTNVPVDKRDKTGSQGKGSRGTFFGHKSSVGAGTRCIPVTAITESGRVSDSTLFPDTFEPIVSLAKSSGQCVWACTADAAYNTNAIIDEIEQADAVPFVDLNPRRSALLKKLKKSVADLSEPSKTALKKGLSKSERKECIVELTDLFAKKKAPGFRGSTKKRR